jgi:hypothetical protein
MVNSHSHIEKFGSVGRVPDMVVWEAIPMILDNRV